MPRQGSTRLQEGCWAIPWVATVVLWSSMLLMAPCHAATDDGEALPAQPDSLAQWWENCRWTDDPQAECMQRQEHRALAAEAHRPAGQARWTREGPVLLWNRPDRPTPFSFTDGDQDHYTLIGPLASTHTWLIATRSAQRSTLLLVDPERTQPLPLRLDAPPRIAPDRHLMVVVAKGDAYGPSTLTLLQHSETGWQIAFRFEAAAGVHLRFASWRKDSAAIHLQWTREAAKGCAVKQGKLQLRDGPYGWDFVPSIPRACPRPTLRSH